MQPRHPVVSGLCPLKPRCLSFGLYRATLLDLEVTIFAQEDGEINYYFILGRLASKLHS